jgi:hypothetical protein
MTPDQKQQHTNRIEGKIAQLEALCETLRFAAKTDNSKDIISVSERMVNILINVSEKEEALVKAKRIEELSDAIIDKYF